MYHVWSMLISKWTDLIDLSVYSGHSDGFDFKLLVFLVGGAYTTNAVSQNWAFYCCAVKLREPQCQESALFRGRFIALPRPPSLFLSGDMVGGCWSLINSPDLILQPSEEHDGRLLWEPTASVAAKLASTTKLLENFRDKPDVGFTRLKTNFPCHYR